jgi:prepilin-type processing-associated H-X9-DG protein
VVIAIIGILAAMLLPTLGAAKESGRRIACLNNLKQLHASLQMYADDNDGQFPPRFRPLWPQRLSRYYENIRILKCPSDSPRASLPANAEQPDFAPRTYLFNGWNDYFRSTLTEDQFWDQYMRHTWQFGMPESVMRQASETIVFGEKREDSFHMHMDLYQQEGNDISQIDNGKHSNPRRQSGGGGSNYAFGDGSARFLRYGTALAPINLWAVTDYARTNAAAILE